MKTPEFRNLSATELTERIRTLQEEYFALQAAVMSGKEKNHARLRPARIDIARAQTVLNEINRKPQA